MKDEQEFQLYFKRVVAKEQRNSNLINITALLTAVCLS